MGNSARLPSGITVRDQGLLEKVLSCPGRTVHVVAIATKPDIIKQAPVYSELKRRNQNVVLVHTGQHYDFALSGGLEDEFGLLPDINLNIRGSAYQQVAQIVARLGEVICVLKEAGKRVIAYVHGDTTTAMAVSNAAFLNQAGSVHVEAGLRTLTPKKSIYEEALRNSLH